MTDDNRDASGREVRLIIYVGPTLHCRTMSGMNETAVLPLLSVGCFYVCSNENETNFKTVQVGLKILKLKISQWASVFSLVKMFQKPGQIFFFVWVEFLMGWKWI